MGQIAVDSVSPAVFICNYTNDTLHGDRIGRQIQTPRYVRTYVHTYIDTRMLSGVARFYRARGKWSQRPSLTEIMN
jgi:hypothetical protein